MELAGVRVKESELSGQRGRFGYDSGAIRVKNIGGKC
jgi:hypothetical protein